MLKYLYNENIKDLVYVKNETVESFYLKSGYVEVSNEFGEKWIQKEMDQRRINELKKLLYETDWKIIVNSELIQQGLEPKYLNLHEERQAWRDEINQLESKIKDEA